MEQAAEGKISLTHNDKFRRSGAAPFSRRQGIDWQIDHKAIYKHPHGKLRHLLWAEKPISPNRPVRPKTIKAPKGLKS